MRIVFAGTPEFAVGCLDAVLQHVSDASNNAELVGVYSQPDRPAGRGRKLQASPVKARALAVSVPVYTPESLRAQKQEAPQSGIDSSCPQAQLRALAPDLIIVVAYGLILPKKVLAIPKHGCWNVHASLLPRWRGAAPIQRAIQAGDQHTGVCLMRMEPGLDTGPVYLRLDTPIAARETAAQLHDRLAALGANLLLDGLRRLSSGQLPNPQAQPETGVLYAHKLDKQEGGLDWTQPAEQLERQIRAFNPYPIAEAQLCGERAQIYQASVVEADGTLHGKNHQPGQICAASKLGIDVQCGGGVLRLLMLKREGGSVIRAADYLNARPEIKRSLFVAPSLDSLL